MEEVTSKMATHTGDLGVHYIPQEKVCILTGQSDLKPSNINQVQRTRGNSLPFFPGSSIKGMLRRNAQRIADLLGFKGCNEKKPEKIIKTHEELGGPCDVCKIFGCPNNASKIQVTDATPTIENPPISIHTGIRLNTKSLTTEPGALFQYEAISKDVRFKGTIRFQNLTEDEFKLLVYSIKELNWSGIGHHGGLLSVKIENTEGLSSNLKKIIQEIFEVV